MLKKKRKMIPLLPVATMEVGIMTEEAGIMTEEMETVEMIMVAEMIITKGTAGTIKIKTKIKITMAGVTPEVDHYHLTLQALQSESVSVLPGDDAGQLRGRLTE